MIDTTAIRDATGGEQQPLIISMGKVPLAQTSA
jgi:hypothetical protein